MFVSCDAIQDKIFTRKKQQDFSLSCRIYKEWDGTIRPAQFVFPFEHTDKGSEEDAGRRRLRAGQRGWRGACARGTPSGMRELRGLRRGAAGRLGTAPGDFVRFTVPEHSVVLGSLIVFAVPLVLAAIFGVLGAYVEGGFAAADGTIGGLVGAAIGLVLGGIVVRWFDRRAARQAPEIIEILKQ